MERMVPLIILILFLMILLACSGEKKPETENMKMDQTQTSVTDTSKTTCPGCGMVMVKSDMVKYDQDGQTLYFCSEHCQKNYLASIEKKTETPPPAVP